MSACQIAYFYIVHFRVNVIVSMTRDVVGSHKTVAGAEKPLGRELHHLGSIVLTTPSN
jgi:hypothetical protein